MEIFTESRGINILCDSNIMLLCQELLKYVCQKCPFYFQWYKHPLKFNTNDNFCGWLLILAFTSDNEIKKYLLIICDMIKRTESDVGDVVFEI